MVNGHSFILIRKMAALIRRALVEVCSVTVLKVVAVLRDWRIRYRLGSRVYSLINLGRHIISSDVNTFNFCCAIGMSYSKQS